MDVSILAGIVCPIHIKSAFEQFGIRGNIDPNRFRKALEPQGYGKLGREGWAKA